MTTRQPTPDVPGPLPGHTPEQQMARLLAWLMAVTADDPVVLDDFADRIYAGTGPQEAAAAALAGASLGL